MSELELALDKSKKNLYYLILLNFYFARKGNLIDKINY